MEKKKLIEQYVFLKDRFGDTKKWVLSSTGTGGKGSAPWEQNPS